MQLTQEIVRELLDYDPDTGILTWKERDVKWFSASGKNTALGNSVRWNSRYSGIQIKTMDSKGYLYVRVFKKHYLAHRIVWLWENGCIPNQIDHINGNKTDNRYINLRNIDNQENSKNRAIGINNKSGVIGIGFHKVSNKWRAEIMNNKKYVYLGLFETKEEAINARKIAESSFNYHENHGRK